MNHNKRIIPTSVTEKALKKQLCKTQLASVHIKVKCSRLTKSSGSRATYSNPS